MHPSGGDGPGGEPERALDQRVGNCSPPRTDTVKGLALAPPPVTTAKPKATERIATLRISPSGAVALVAQAPVGETGEIRPHRYPRPCPAPRSAFTGYRFPPEVITLAVRWYLRFGLSYRDVEELLSERGIEVDHVSIYRWVQRFAPEFAEAARARQHVIGDRWHVDETYVKVGGTWRYLFRAIDQFGQVIDVFLSPRRNSEAARGFFARWAGPGSHQWRSPPTGTGSIPASSMSCCLRPSMTRR
jgi:hypothetical protein